MNTKTFAKVSMIAAVYTVLTLVLAPISYGNLQIRVSEALTMLPLIYQPSIYGVTLGCFLSNLIGAMSGVNPTGYIDAVVGTAATFFAAYCTWKLRDKKVGKYPLFAILMPVIWNFFFVGAELGRTVQEAELSVSDDCTSLAQYLEKFDLPGQCIQDEKGLEGAAYDVLKGMHRENIVYAEIRFAPLLSENESMSCERVIEATIKGLERGKKDFGIEYGLIVCAMRHHSEEQNRRMLHTAREFLGAGVCAADLAGAEVPYPMSGFMELFKYAKQLGLPFTIHAGECGNAQNIIDAVEAGAARIGHGIAMRGHGDMERQLSAKGIGIELCPISNLQTKAVASADEYPIREFLDAGLKVTINTDNRTVSNTTLSKELEFIERTYGIRDEELPLMMKNALDVAFADDAVKERMLKYV